MSMTNTRPVASEPQGDQTPAVRLQGVRHEYRGRDGEPFLAIERVDIDAQQGEFVAIVGPSGCGKSTLLSLVAGLATSVAGDVEVGGVPVDGVRRDVGFVFQRDALLPWRTVLQNVELPLRFRKVPRDEARERARSWIAKMGLARFENRFPAQLSGGQRKRVSLAATLVYEPAILLMDEPFSALDVQTRELIENDILEVWQTNRQTVLFVTHDLEEAIALSDRVVVLTASPARVLSNYPVTLERPRDMTTIKVHDDFHELHRLIWDDLRLEVLRAAGRDTGGPA